MHFRPFRRPLGRLAGLASLVAAISLFAVPLAFAGTETGGEHQPEGVPPGYSGKENPGSENMPEGVPPEATLLKAYRSGRPKKLHRRAFPSARKAPPRRKGSRPGRPKAFRMALPQVRRPWQTA